MTSTEPALQHVLAQERAHHERCRTALASMVEGAGEQVAIGEDVSASGADAEVLGHRLRSRAKALRELPEGPLFFGALQGGDGPLHLGRLRISEHPAEPPLVVDWRAPVSRAFYQASARDPQGVAVRRRFGWAPGSRGDSGDLTGLEDEHLGRGETRDSEIVAREIERPRVGPMRDIAATIQPEQDDLVDGELRERATTVEGVPGAVVQAVRDALRREGSVGIVAADADVPRVRAALDAAGIEAAGPDDVGAPVSLVPASLVKGLEYDHVVAVEPAAIAEAEERGLHRLYVVLTRAVSRLEVVRGRPLPF
ncbi:hypothetical protein QNO09_30285 [Streptomyces sp. 378]|uniref:hypothetical protein n=1 Tax=Streptomyces sp. 378 TaxID=3049412 RepID=UPI0024C3C607|nr:hypothetical protein [Streptomyces sp. 378]MDK1347514.1 hypothetical protein [Streptomyces sp. 378]